MSDTAPNQPDRPSYEQRLAALPQATFRSVDLGYEFTIQEGTPTYDRVSRSSDYELVSGNENATIPLGHEPPPKNASQAAWAEFLVAHKGWSAGVATGLTRDQLVAAYEGNSNG